MGGQLTATPTNYEPLLFATMGFGATLLGLYFAAISIVVSTRYASAPQNVRELILTERSGTTYTRLVSILVAASLLLLAIGFVGYKPGALTLVMIAVLAVGSIVGLLSVGPRAFQLLSLEEIANPILQDFVQWARKVMGRTRGKEFEDHHRRSAAQALDTYEAVIALSIHSESPRQVGQLANGLCQLWRFYSYLKPRIPLESWWFQRQPTHVNWWMAGDIQVSQALNTGTGLSPKDEPDGSWVEKRLVSLLTPAVAYLAQQDEVAILHDLAVGFAVNARKIAGALQTDDVLRTLAVFSLQPLLNPALASHDGAPSATTQRNAILDDMGLLVINLVLGLQDAATELAGDGLWVELEEALKTGATKAGSPLGACLRVIQELRSGVAFEERAEGRRISPSWWIRQQVARRLYVVLDEAVDKTLKALAAEIVARAETAVDPVNSATLASRALEATNKLFAHLPTIESALVKLEATRNSKEDWPTRVSSDANERTQALLDRTVDVLAKQLPELAKVSTDDQPDFFGQAFFVLVNECFAALVSDREERFLTLFQPTLLGAMEAHDRLGRAFNRPNADHWSERIVKSAAIEDVLELSGYALVFGELGSTHVWDGCRHAWDEWLAARQDAVALLRHLLALVTLRENQFALLPGEVIRTSRHQRFSAYLSEKLGVSDLWEGGGVMFGSDSRLRRPIHASPIVQLAVEPFSVSDPEGLFIVKYVAGMLPPGTELPRKARNAAESLALRERRSQVSATGDVDDDVDQDDEEQVESEPGQPEGSSDS